MKFELDTQTIKDLEIFGDGKSSNCIFKFYNKTKTNGGRNHLLTLMENPITDIHELRQRSQLIEYLSSIQFEFKVNFGQMDFIDTYERLNVLPLRNNIIDAIFQNISYRIKPTNHYYLIQSGIQQLAYLIIEIEKFVNCFNSSEVPSSMIHYLDILNKFISINEFQIIKKKCHKLNFVIINRVDKLFRKTYKSELMDFTQTIYILDAFISISKVANEQGLTTPEYVDSSTPKLSIQDLHHPLVPNAVPCNIEMTEENNLCFLTGANMAGKSTFLKSLGVAIYISHLGFPVPAHKIRTSVYNGIVTTINLADNMNKGYSHFYSEVIRVKESALKLKEKNKLFVIFDELFRGTNVKDAFDASLLIIKSLAKINNSAFCISTHITEIAKELKPLTNIDYKYFDSELIDDTPVYTYELKNGVSHERLGMHIVKNERIVEILNSITDLT